MNDEVSKTLECYGVGFNARSLPCKECKKKTGQNQFPSRCEVVRDYEPGNCLLLTCGVCNTQWYMCVKCDTTYTRNANAKKHWVTERHKSKFLNVLDLEYSMQSLIKVMPELPHSELEHSAHSDQLNENEMKTSFQDVLRSLPEFLEALGQETLMMNYHLCEFAKPYTGLRYLVTRAFTKNEYPSWRTLAHTPECRWHFYCFVQYMSMTEKQRKRQGKLITRENINSSLFECTKVPTYVAMNKIYGRSNQYSMWRSLPIPTVQNIGGIAYINPLNVISYLLANGTDLDHYMVHAGKNYDDDEGDDDKTINYVTESSTAKIWRQEIKKKFKDITAILLWVVDWRDGFGANRTKQNRKSTVAWTISVSTPRKRINAIDNTRAIALGLKKNINWPSVEHKFQEDMALFANGLNPVKMYHGGLKKCIPVFVKRFACLTDKVERADYTSTMSCTSSYHRLYGKILEFESPKKQLGAIDEYKKKCKDGSNDAVLKQYGWSSDMIDHINVGGLLPACYTCRKNNLNWLKRESGASIACDQCANWKVDLSTKEMLKFPVPADYPTLERCLPDCPVVPPAGRQAGLSHLHYIDVNFEFLKHSVRYAFFHYKSEKKDGWTQKMTSAYLRTCGINQHQQTLIQTAALQAHASKTEIDWNSDIGVGEYLFPAAWMGDLPISHFIEMIMHLLFLGIAESNFALCCMYLIDIKKLVSFKKRAHQLLIKLTKFNLSWLLVFPFSGKTLTTGTWVSENWLAWIRISKICFAFCIQGGITDERLGAYDLLRMVCSFTALVARVLSHAGSSRRTAQIIDCILKEFLSSVQELDIRVNVKATKAKATKDTAATEGKVKGKDLPWWVKSNYISTLNLTPSLLALGPLSNYWDGGGKGERYIQEIKPHIPRGIRDGLGFFVSILERVFRFDCITLMEKSLDEQFGDKEIDNIPSVFKKVKVEEVQHNESEDECIESNVERHWHEFSDSDESDESDDDDCMETMVNENDDEDILREGTPPDGDGDKIGEEIEVAEDEEGEWGEWGTPMESDQMSKARTFYIYKKRDIFKQALEAAEPISGILVTREDKSLEFLVVYRNGKQFQWDKIEFDDIHGVSVFGLWYAPISLGETNAPPPNSIKELTKSASMATVAIPLRLGVDPQLLGVDNPMVLNGKKYCVITNWWRERDREGFYSLPSIAFDYYHDK